MRDVGGEIHVVHMQQSCYSATIMNTFLLVMSGERLSSNCKSVCIGQLPKRGYVVVRRAYAAISQVENKPCLYSTHVVIAPGCCCSDKTSPHVTDEPLPNFHL